MGAAASASFDVTPPYSNVEAALASGAKEEDVRSWLANHAVSANGVLEPVAAHGRDHNAFGVVMGLRSSDQTRTSRAQKGNAGLLTLNRQDLRRGHCQVFVFGTIAVACCGCVSLLPTSEETGQRSHVVHHWCGC
jgi:hypothetical protein